MPDRPAATLLSKLWTLKYSPKRCDQCVSAEAKTLVRVVEILEELNWWVKSRRNTKSIVKNGNQYRSLSREGQNNGKLMRIALFRLKQIPITQNSSIMDNDNKLIYLEKVIQLQKEQYFHLTNIISSNNNKSQINISTSGLFISVIYAAGSKFFLINHSEINSTAIAWVSIIFFVISIFLSLGVLLVGKIPISDDGDLMHDFLSTEERKESHHIMMMYNTMALRWKERNKNMLKRIESKSRILFLSQLTLSLGITVIALLAWLNL